MPVLEQRLAEALARSWRRPAPPPVPRAPCRRSAKRCRCARPGRTAPSCSRRPPRPAGWPPGCGSSRRRSGRCPTNAGRACPPAAPPRSRACRSAQEGTDAALAGGLVGHRQHDGHVGMLAAGDELLDAVEHVVVAVAARRGAQRGASEPTWGSVRQKAPSISPRASGTSHCCFCASLAKAISMLHTGQLLTLMTVEVPPSPAAISSGSAPATGSRARRRHRLPAPPRHRRRARPAGGARPGKGAVAVPLRGAWRDLLLRELAHGIADHFLFGVSSMLLSVALGRLGRFGSLWVAWGRLGSLGVAWGRCPSNRAAGRRDRHGPRARLARAARRRRRRGSCRCRPGSRRPARAACRPRCLPPRGRPRSRHVGAHPARMQRDTGGLARIQRHTH